MSDMIRVVGKTLADAITNATIQLGVASDHIIYNVIEHESKGFLGIGQKNAVIEVRVKTEADFEAERLKQKAEEEAAAKAVQAVSEKQAAEEKAVETVTVQKEESSVQEEMVSEAVQESESICSDMQQDMAGEDEQDEASSYKRREREIKPLENPQEAIDKVENFLRDIYRAMDMDVELVSNYDGEVLNVQMNGDDMGILIGKRGQTLDSLQYLVSLVVNKGSSSYVRIKLDTENYRERRKATLENLAKNISVKVRKTRQNVYLEPMNPYERRIIHSALQDDPFVTTHSEGEEPDRKVVVTLRADADLEALDRKYGEKHYRSGRGGYRNSRGSGRGNRRYSKHRENRYNDGVEGIDPVQIPETGSADSSGE